MLMTVHDVLYDQFGSSVTHRQRVNAFVYDLLTKITAQEHEGLGYNIALLFCRKPNSPHLFVYHSGIGPVDAEDWSERG